MKRIAALALLAGLMACGGEEDKLTEGEVVEKSYDDPDTWTTTICVAYGKYGCSVWVPQQQSDGPHWFLTVVGEDAEGEQREEDHEVTQTLFDMVSEGSYVDLRDGSTASR